MIQDIYPHQLNNHYDPGVQTKKEDTLLCIVNGRILVEETCFEENELRFPRVKDLADEYVADIRYLFAIDDSRYFLCDHLLEQKDIPEGYAYVDEKSLRKEGIGPDEALFAAVTGKHLADWYRDTKFCGRCGHEMQHSKTERAMVCPACHYTAYPRIMPAVIVGVTNGDKLLITRYRTGFRYNALIAGFTEIGETMEETVQREVMEEAGIRVKNIRYYKSQPWSFSSTLLCGFFCDVDGDTSITLDTNELALAEWFARENIPVEDDGISLTREMIRVFKHRE